MLWKEVNTGDTLYDMRTGHIIEVRSAYTKRGTFGKGGWNRAVKMHDVVTGEDWSWDYDNSGDTEPYKLAKRG